MTNESGECKSCDKLADALAAALAECEEQARLNGAGASREAALMAKLASLKGPFLLYVFCTRKRTLTMAELVAMRERMDAMSASWWWMLKHRIAVKLGMAGRFE